MSEDMKNSISMEDAAKVAEVLEEIKDNSKDLTTISQLPSNNGIETSTSTEKGEYKMVDTKVDPVTGETSILNTEVKNDNTETFDEMCARLERGEFKNVDNSPVTAEELKASMSDTSITGVDELSNDPEVMMALLDLVNRKLKKEEFNAYKEMPEKVKDLILKYASNGSSVPINSNQFKAMRNMMAEALLDEFTTNIMSERASLDLNKEIEEIFAKGTAEIGDSIIGYTTERNAKYREAAEKLNDPEKKANLLHVLDEIDEAHKLTGLKEFSKKCKIRSIDIENAGKNKKTVYDYDSLLLKYEPSQYNIYSIYSAETILARNIIANYPNMADNAMQYARAFLLAFCKQTSSYTPTNTFNHAYMYYVLYNVVLLDINTGNSKPVSLEFLTNVKECIDNLIARNSCLKKYNNN